MNELYKKHKEIFSLVALFVFYGLFAWLIPTQENVPPSLQTFANLALAIVAVIYVLPLLVAVWGSFTMFLTSPIFVRRWKKFKNLKRGYYAFLIVICLFGLSFFSEFLINGKAIMVKYQGRLHFTLFSFESARSFGMKGFGIPNYRLMKEVYKSNNEERAARIKSNSASEEDKKYNSWGDDWVWMPIYPYGPIESLLDELPCRPPHPPTWLEGRWQQAFFQEGLFEFPENPPDNETLEKTYGHPEWVGLSTEVLYKEMAVAGLLKLKPGVTRPDFFQHLLGTDDRGRDVFARMVYGFRTSLSFALLVTLFCYIVGISIGALLGYYGGKFDIVMQRFVEIWSAMPFLYTVMIFAAIMIPNFWMLVFILVLFKWMGMTYYIRAEFLREKSRDYVAAAKAIGCTDSAIIFRHILPNALTPVISFAPFAVVANIGALVSLDFLGFGLPAPTSSWGELLGQGLGNLTKPWLILSPTLAMFFTLLLVSFIGEAIREAFDPKQYSRLR